MVQTDTESVQAPRASFPNGPGPTRILIRLC